MNLRLSVIQMNSKIASRDSNVEKACNMIDEAAKMKPDIILLPELFNVEYFPQYRDHKYLSYAEKDSEYTISQIKVKAREHSIFIAATIFESEIPGINYDSTIIVTPMGEILGKYRKIHPAAVLSLEKIYFRPGSKFPIFKINNWKVGILICYDHCFPESARSLTVKGADLILIPFATTIYKNIWYSSMMTRAWENGIFLAAANKVGREGDWVFNGRSLIANPFGEIVTKASEKEEDIIFAELDHDLICKARKKWPMLRDRRPEIYYSLVKYQEDVTEA